MSNGNKSQSSQPATTPTTVGDHWRNFKKNVVTPVVNGLGFGKKLKKPKPPKKQP